MNAGPLLSAQLRGETILSERLRARILAYLFLSASLLFLLLTALLPADYEKVFGTGPTRYQLTGMLFAVALYEYALNHVIRFREHRGKMLPEPVRYWNALVEISIPTVGMLILSSSIPPLLTLVSPLTALYFIFILLSILRLNVLLSLWTGLLAALQYVGIAWYFHQNGGGEGVAPMFDTTALYVARSVMLLGAGIVAGVIARIIREKIVHTVQEVEAKNQAIDLFGQQVSEPVARELLRSAQALRGRLRSVTVMFLDIRDFTPFTARHAPDEVVNYLNTLFSFMIRVIGAHAGIVNQFLGDGFMTTFGAPLEDEEHAAHAVASAIEIHAGIQRMVEEGSIPPTRIGIGIHSGEALTGNIGSAERRQYSVTGSTVILASRIEQLNKIHGSDILISEETFRMAKLDSATCERIENVTVKGRADRFTIYRLA
ncbi:MAG: adenylate/guanylate cyclase domain-containing protein [Bacteroidota bacterium]|nr:adenylate/guanylate cyclase domain-containing protein [Bacteroidota bacterium]